jgi:hypothetical protein
MRKILKYFVLIPAFSLIAVNFASATSTTTLSVASANNQSSNLQDSFKKIQESVQEVKDSTKNLITTKESETLSPEEKNKQELNQRLDIYKKVIALSVKEAEDTNNQLKKLANLDEKNSAWRDQFLAVLEGFLKFYAEQNKILEKSEEIDLVKIKEIAQSFKDWREEIYLPEFTIITDFLLINQQRATLEMVQNRFNKISSDVLKLEKINFKGINELKKSLSLAANYIKEAKDLRQEAEDKFLILEEVRNATSTNPTTASSTTATSTDINASVPESTSTESTTVLNATITVENASSTTASSTIATSTPSISIEDQFLSIKGLVGNSLNKIKATYQIFIEMSNFVKKLLI